MQHAEEIARVVGVGDHVEILIKPSLFQPVSDIAQFGEILDGKSHTVKKRDLAIICSPRSGAVDHLPYLSVTGKSAGIC